MSVRQHLKLTSKVLFLKKPEMYLQITRGRKCHLYCKMNCSFWIENVRFTLPNLSLPMQCLWYSSVFIINGRFPFNKNHRFKFSEFSLVVLALQPRGMLGETLLCLKMADFLNISAALEQGDCETISCTILDSNDDVILLAAVAYFMRRE